jgi:hypothetical protein
MLYVMKAVAPASQLAMLIANYAPEVARAFKVVRRRMRGFVPRGYELLYENYNALGIGYGGGEKSSDVILSIVAYPRWVTLFFFDGANLHDPNSILDGTGKRIRSIRLQSPSDIDRADVRQLISEALAPHAGALAGCPRLTLVIRSIASKRRARRPRQRKASKASVNSPGKSSRSNDV